MRQGPWIGEPRKKMLSFFYVISLLGSANCYVMRHAARMLQQELPAVRQFSPLLSARNVNENGEPISDLLSSSSPVGEAAALGFRYRNDTDHDDGDDDGDGECAAPNGIFDVAAVMSSVTHWADIMRQGSWLGENVTTALLLDAVLSDVDLEQIEGYWDRLMPTVSYLGTVQVAKIYKGLCVAYRAHRGQMRKSGEPFIVHVRCFVTSFISRWLPMPAPVLRRVRIPYTQFNYSLHSLFSHWKSLSYCRA